MTGPAARASRDDREGVRARTIGPAISAIGQSGLAQAQDVLETWAAKEMWQRKSDGLLFSR